MLVPRVAISASPTVIEADATIAAVVHALYTDGISALKGAMSVE